MEIDKIKNYHLLSENKLIIKELNTVCTLEEILKSQEERLQQRIGDIQKNCQHIWTEKRVYNGNINTCYKGNMRYTSKGIEVCDSKICSECGTEEKKPNGRPTEICYVCWSPMKHEDTIPGHGERIHIYDCTNSKCNNGSWDT